jgi:hypothetical protein
LGYAFNTIAAGVAPAVVKMYRVLPKLTLVVSPANREFAAVGLGGGAVAAATVGVVVEPVLAVGAAGDDATGFVAVFVSRAMGAGCWRRPPKPRNSIGVKTITSALRSSAKKVRLSMQANVFSDS